VTRLWVLEGAGIFALHHCIQTSSGTHPTSCPVGNGVSFLGIKQLWHETDHSPPSRAQVKNAWSYIFTPPYVFMVWYFVKHRDNFTYTFMAQILKNDSV
jgi:hypothetical protein